MKIRRVCLTPYLHGIGGMVSFQGRLAQGLARRGIEVSYDLEERPLDAVLVVGGTRHLGGLWRARRDGIPVVHRLNGMNWLHRRRRTGLRHYVRAEYGNILLSFIRSKLAGGVVYQSQFAKSWWERVYGPTRKPDFVIYNAVDLQAYTPDGKHDRPENYYRVLMVEGNLGGGYELGLGLGVGLVERLQGLDFPVELVVAGKVSSTLRAEWQQKAHFSLRFAGVVNAQDIPALDRSAHLFYSADLHPACPNSVIEALACGLPTVSLETGALAELVQGDAGIITPYGGNAWKLEPPDLDGLAKAAAQVLQEQVRFRTGARRRAETAFDLEAMVDAYLHSFDLVK